MTTTTLQAGEPHRWHAAAPRTPVLPPRRVVAVATRTGRRGCRQGVWSDRQCSIPAPPFPGRAAYHATKGAVRNMTKNAAMTYVADGIRVNSVHPGFIDTPLTQAQEPALNDSVIASTPMKRAGKPIEIAYGCLFLASDESSYVTGIELPIDGGYLAQ